ncbi:MAG: CHASE2 domain-containing protein, partial [Spirochaetota bacterium]
MQRVYDTLLHIKPPVPEREEIFLLDVDDTAIANVGLWPWSRDYMARGLISLTEFDAAYVIFDVEYVDASPQAVDGRFLRNELPEVFDARIARLVDQIDALFGALSAGQIPLEQAPDFIDQWEGFAWEVRDELVGTVGEVVRDNDTFLGHAARFHGSAYFTVNILRYEESVDFNAELLRETAVLSNIRAMSDHGVRVGVDVWPAIEPVLSGAAGAGFPNVVVDPDGVRRRIDLFARVDDNYYAQLVTEPLLDWLGRPEVEVTNNAVIFRGAVHPDSDEPADITVPLATDGRMLINWPKGEYEETFRHDSFWRLVFDWEYEAEMVELLRDLMPNLARYYPNSDSLLPLYDFAQSIRDDVLAGGDREQLAEWREYRAMFFETLGDFVESDALDLLLGDLRAAIDSGEYAAEVIPQLEEIGTSSERWFALLGERYERFWENRQELLEELPGTFVIIGHVGTSTTDIGVTPFDEEYMNVGTHAAVVNTILEQEFLDDLPWIVSVAVMLVIGALVTLLISRMDPTPSLLVGFGAIIVIAGGGVALFLLTGTYLNMVTPLAGVFLTFVILTAMKFVHENQQKVEIRNAFGHYMSEEVVRQVTEDPTKLALGGVKKHLTAMFTDIRGFSTISESLEPEQLTDLLNRYLGAMSDIIIDEGGTIDKFEGDAIIAFFGAPIDQDDSAVRACRAAIQMKKVEAILNEEFMRDQIAPSPIYTRIGINTGDMVVGNMGTATRMDYTAMGHNMNLAARLEGVNKQYGTWVLVSEQTYRETYNEQTRAFSVRKLDRVRVVGISEPVRLYELIDLRDEVDDDPELISKLRTFNSGLTAFEEKEWDTALKHFQEVLDTYPEDGPARYYADRCKAFKRKPPARDWDGVFNLTKK